MVHKIEAKTYRISFLIFESKLKWKIMVDIKKKEKFSKHQKPVNIF